MVAPIKPATRYFRKKPSSLVFCNKSWLIVSGLSVLLYHGFGRSSNSKSLVLLLHFAVNRGRLAIAVKAGQKGSLTKGSVKLGASGSGATLYMEPAEVIELNNMEAALGDQEAEEERAVLSAVSRKLASRGRELRGLVEAVAALDIVGARAAHGEWLGATRPRFVSRYAVDTPSPLCVPCARHPLLLEPGLPPLARPPSAEDVTLDLIQAPAWATSSSRKSSSRSSSSGEEEMVLPRALELVVPPSTKVVAITGPNTGEEGGVGWGRGS